MKRNQTRMTFVFLSTTIIIELKLWFNLKSLDIVNIKLIVKNGPEINWIQPDTNNAPSNIFMVPKENTEIYLAVQNIWKGRPLTVGSLRDCWKTNLLRDHWKTNYEKNLWTVGREIVLSPSWSQTEGYIFSFVAMRDGAWAFGALYCSVNSFTSCFTVAIIHSSY